MSRRTEALLQQARPFAGQISNSRLALEVSVIQRLAEDLCRRLIACYETQGGQPSGVMRERGGKTVGVLDDFKKRFDEGVGLAGALGGKR